VIDFRYHLVSIIAVFLALAVGIVVGSTALQPTVESGLHATENLLRRRIDQVEKNNTTLNQQVSETGLPEPVIVSQVSRPAPGRRTVVREDSAVVACCARVRSGGIIIDVRRGCPRKDLGALSLEVSMAAEGFHGNRGLVP